MCTVLLPPGVKPIEVNKYIMSYQVAATKVNCALHQHTLTFQSLPITLRTSKSNIQKFCMVIALHLYIPYGSQDKQQLLPYTSLTDLVL